MNVFPTNDRLMSREFFFFLFEYFHLLFFPVVMRRFRNTEYREIALLFDVFTLNEMAALSMFFFSLLLCIKHIQETNNVFFKRE